MDTQTIKSLYYSLFHSHMTYGCLTWGLASKSNISRIIKLQQHALRIISFSDYDAPTSDLFSLLKVLKLEDAIKLNLCFLMHDWYNNRLPKCFNKLFSYRASTINTRKQHSLQLSLPLRRTERYGTSSIKFQGASLYNYLYDIDIKISNPKRTFGKEVKSLLMASYA